MPCTVKCNAAAACVLVMVGLLRYMYTCQAPLPVRREKAFDRWCNHSVVFLSSLIRLQRGVVFFSAECGWPQGADCGLQQ